MKKILSLALVLVCVFMISGCQQSDINTKCPPVEVAIELNDKTYSVINTEAGPAYDEYNLEKNITSDLLGEYLGQTTIQVNNTDKDTFNLYRYSKAPTTKYNWYPRIIAEASNKQYYHALVASPFDVERQTADEVLTVYGLLSVNDIISIENQHGKKITDRDFIKSFYNGLFTKEYGDNEFLQENVYQDTEIDESEMGKLYSKHADDMVYLKINLSNGLVMDIAFTSHNYVEIDHGLFFEVDNNWLDLVSELN